MTEKLITICFANNTFVQYKGTPSHIYWLQDQFTRWQEKPNSPQIITEIKVSDVPEYVMGIDKAINPRLTRPLTAFEEGLRRDLEKGLITQSEYDEMTKTKKPGASELNDPFYQKDNKYPDPSDWWKPK